MARNIERDQREADRRKKQLIEAAFELFSKNGIENVSLKEVADRADVGAATLYKYYTNKERLVVATSADIWKSYWENILKRNSPGFFEKMNAYSLLEFYCDCIIDIYKKRPDILRFSGNFKTYICRLKLPEEELSLQLSSLEPLNRLFHEKYISAMTDKSMRTDIPETKLFTTLSITMLALAERYAQGIVWANDHEGSNEQELIYLKEMLLNWAKG